MAASALATALRLPPMPFSTRLALRQLRYKGANLLGVFAGVCVAIVLVFVQIGFEQATVNSVLNFDRALRADLVIVGPQFEVIGYSPPWFNREVLYRAEDVAGVADARPLYMFVTQVRNWKGQQPLAARFTAFDPARPVLDLPRVNAQLDRLATPYSVLIDQKSRDDLGAFADRIARGEAPQSLYLQNAAADLAPRVDVVGAYSLGPDFTSFGAFLASDLTFYRLFHFPLDRVSLGLVQLKPGQNPRVVRDAIAKAVGTDAQVYTHKQFIDIERNYFVYRTPVGIVFLSGIGIGVVIGTVFVLNMLHGIIDSNLSEYAVLRAMGYRDKFFRSLVLQIATLITSVAFVPSVLATLLIYASLAHATRLPFALTVPQAILVFCASLIMSMAAALLAIRKLRTSNPLELFS